MSANVAEAVFLSGRQPLQSSGFCATLGSRFLEADMHCMLECYSIVNANSTVTVYATMCPTKCNPVLHFLGLCLDHPLKFLQVPSLPFFGLRGPQSSKTSVAQHSSIFNNGRTNSQENDKVQVRDPVAARDVLWRPVEDLRRCHPVATGDAQHQNRIQMADIDASSCSVYHRSL